jgi:hypothetical protein
MAASDSGEHSLKLRIEIENCLSTLQQNLPITVNNRNIWIFHQCVPCRDRN